MKNFLIFTLSLSVLLSSCNEAQKKNNRSTLDKNISYKDIDPSIYFSDSALNDPYKELYTTFRTQRSKDLDDPDAPRPLADFQLEFKTNEMAWSNLEDVFTWDWETIKSQNPDQLTQLKKIIKVRVGFDHPDFKIIQLMIAPKATLPAHAEAAPGMFHIIEGEAKVTVEGESYTVTPGTSVKLEPFDIRKIEVKSESPLKILWFRWAPNGDQKYMASGYYLTGANQHIQPIEANLPQEINFFGSKNSIKKLEINSDIALIRSQPQMAKAKAELDSLKKESDGVLYANTKRWSQESENSWIFLNNMPKNSGFFWAEDADKMSALTDRVAEVFRIKGFFRAVRPDGGYDFNVSYTVWGPHSRYVEHSHATPEFYYHMSGPTEHWVEGKKFRAEPGNIYFHNAYSPHQSRGFVDDLRDDVITGSWPPNGDRSVFLKPFYLVENLADQKNVKDLPENLKFH